MHRRSPGASCSISKYHGRMLWAGACSPMAVVGPENYHDHDHRGRLFPFASCVLNDSGGPPAPRRLREGAAEGERGQNGILHVLSATHRYPRPHAAAPHGKHACALATGFCHIRASLFGNFLRMLHLCADATAYRPRALMIRVVLPFTRWWNIPESISDPRGHAYACAYGIPSPDGGSCCRPTANRLPPQLAVSTACPNHTGPRLTRPKLLIC